MYLFRFREAGGEYPTPHRHNRDTIKEDRFVEPARQPTPLLDEYGYKICNERVTASRSSQRVSALLTMCSFFPSLPSQPVGRVKEVNRMGMGVQLEVSG